MAMDRSDPQAFRRRESAEILTATFMLIPRFNMMTVTGMVEPMRIANYLAPSPIYAWRFVSFDGPEVQASNGMTLPCAVPPERARPRDLFLVAGSWGCERWVSPKLVTWTRLMARQGARLCAVELGAYVLARAGLLDGRAATTHFSCLAGLRERFPDIALSEQLYTVDDRLMAVAGGTAGIDFMLRLIAEDAGERLAGEVSDQMMHHPVRPPEARQRKTLGRGMDALPPEVRMAIGIIEANISEPPTVPEIAAKIGISQRQLERRFKAAMGCSVVQFGQLLRLQHARVLLVSTTLTIREVAVASGFNTMSHFAHAFRKCFGRRPSQYRQMWPDQDAAPSWPGTLFSVVDAMRIDAAPARH